MVTAQMLEVAPYLVVTDPWASIGHYESRLGFELTQVEGDPPSVAVLSRDGIAVMLRLGDPSTRGKGAEATAGGSFSAAALQQLEALQRRQTISRPTLPPMRRKILLPSGLPRASAFPSLAA